MNLWNAFLTEVRTTSESNIKEWCIKNAIDLRRWIQLTGLINVSCEIMQQNRYTIIREKIPVETIVKLLQPVMANVYRDQIYKCVQDSNKYYYRNVIFVSGGQRGMTSTNHYLDRFGIVNTYRNNHPTYLVGIITGETAAGGILLLTLDIPPELI